MGTEENKAIVRRFIEEVWNKKNFAAIDEVIAPNFSNSVNGSPLSPGTLASVRQGHEQLLKAVPDSSWAIEQIVAEADTVVVRCAVRGTHQGRFAGTPLNDIEPTGKPIAYESVMIFRVSGGKIVENRGYAPFLGIRRQLGATTIPALPATPR